MNAESERYCYMDKDRPCNAHCPAHNAKPLEGGVHCIDLASKWAHARGQHKLASAINHVSTLITMALGAARG